MSYKAVLSLLKLKPITLSTFINLKVHFDFQVIITSSGDEKAELSQKILDVLYATEVPALNLSLSVLIFVSLSLSKPPRC